MQYIVCVGRGLYVSVYTYVHVYVHSCACLCVHEQEERKAVDDVFHHSIPTSVLRDRDSHSTRSDVSRQHVLVILLSLPCHPPQHWS